MADRRFKRFTEDIKVVIDTVMFDKNNHKLIKDIKKDVEENTVKLEEIWTHMEGLYSATVKNYPDEMKELTKNFKVIEEGRSTVRTKVKDALAAVEAMRNKEQQQRAEEDVPVLPRRGGRDGRREGKW